MSLNQYPNGQSLHDPFPIRREEAIKPQSWADLQRFDPRLSVGRLATFTTGRLRGPTRNETSEDVKRPFETTKWGPGLERLDIPY